MPRRPPSGSCRILLTRASLEAVELNQDQTAFNTTGVPGLDTILGGGVPSGAMLFLVGAPGVGKTILALQMTFHLARAGRPVLFLSALSEPHDKLLSNVRAFGFFQEDLIGNGVELVSLNSLLATGPEETIDNIVSMARRGHFKMVVIDGFGGGFLESDRAIREFLYDLGAKLGMLEVSLVVTMQGNPHEPARYPELTIADGIVGLFYERHGATHRRYVEVVKLRGAHHLDGLHSLSITPSGLICYPQLESLPLEPARSFGSGRATFDLPALDAMLGGGLTGGTVTVLAGSIGTGKTLASLYFVLAGAARGESGLFVSFHESEAQLLAKSAAFGLDLSGALKSGLARILSYPPVRLDPDIVAQEIRDVVDESQIQRLVIDSSAALERALDRNREADYLAALVAYLRARGVTTLVTREILQIVGGGLDFSGTSAAVLAENLILLRLVESQTELRRLISVMNMRFSDFDRSIREYTIEPDGIAVLDSSSATPARVTTSSSPPLGETE
jgi:circadian clock protein KaiC